MTGEQRTRGYGYSSRYTSSRSSAGGRVGGDQHDGEKVKLASFWKDQKLVIVFLRRFDCQTCFSYIVLFAHLRPILTATNTRIIFLTCHENLSEVQVFLTSFAYWLRTLQPPDDPDDDQKTSGRVGVGTRLGALLENCFLILVETRIECLGLGIS
ncbi:hypothetical protein BC829DRAFT_240341 [Chytridium lagenaria]|nr:hypothetical protein BC829DRAFT_240341 [Chytridium lagenaria]